MKTTVIEGGRGGRLEVGVDQFLEIINVEGQQICDFFSFCADDVSDYLSPAHCRTAMRRVFLKVGDKLVSVRRRPMWEIIEDTVGRHDMCMPACDPNRYLLDFGVAGHANCRDNLAEVMKDYRIPYNYLPDPINFFQNTPILADGKVGRGVSPAKAGDRIVLRALTDVIAVGSACPQDLDNVNGGRPTSIRFVARTELA